MDRVLWQQHLKEVEHDVAEGQRHITKQAEIIAKLERLGTNTQLARDLLATLESLQVQHIAHRDRLRRELEGSSLSLRDKSAS